MIERTGRADLDRIEVIAVQELSSVLAERWHGNWRPSVTPISETRCLAHTHNPVADPQDPALLVATRNEVCTGYLGLVPTLVRFGERSHKVLVMSTWYVMPELRSAGIGLKLLFDALDLGYDLYVCDHTPGADRIYSRLPAFRKAASLSITRFTFEPTVQWFSLLSRLTRARKLRRLSPLFRSLERSCRGHAIRHNSGLAQAIDHLSGEGALDWTETWGTLDGSDWCPGMEEDSLVFDRGRERAGWTMRFPWFGPRPQAGYEFDRGMRGIRYVSVSFGTEGCAVYSLLERTTGSQLKLLGCSRQSSKLHKAACTHGFRLVRRYGALRFDVESRILEDSGFDVPEGISGQAVNRPAYWGVPKTGSLGAEGLSRQRATMWDGDAPHF